MGSLKPDDPNFWDNEDLSNLQNIRLLAASSENQRTIGIISYLTDYLNSNVGELNYAEWFNYVKDNDPTHKENVHIKEFLDYSDLYTFDSKPIFFSNIQGDRSWANQFGPVTLVPEPATISFLGLGLVGLLLREKAPWHPLELQEKYCGVY